MIRHGMKYGEVYITSPGCEGVAIWAPPNTHYHAWWSNFISGRFLLTFIMGIDSTKRQMAFEMYAREVRKRVVPFSHWYLQLLGVAPECQGLGFSSRLLTPVLARIDKEGSPCFVETQDEKNVAIYEHFGFKVGEEGIVPGTNIKHWAMLRKND